jgi:hypothetical protein
MIHHLWLAEWHICITNRLIFLTLEKVYLIVKLTSFELFNTTLNIVSRQFSPQNTDSAANCYIVGTVLFKDSGRVTGGCCVSLRIVTCWELSQLVLVFSIHSVHLISQPSCRSIMCFGQLFHCSHITIYLWKWNIKVVTVRFHTENLET